jgi:hypothetical protein
MAVRLSALCTGRALPPQNIICYSNTFPLRNSTHQHWKNKFPRHKSTFRLARARFSWGTAWNIFTLEDRSHVTREHFHLARTRFREEVTPLRLSKTRLNLATWRKQAILWSPSRLRIGKAPPYVRNTFLPLTTKRRNIRLEIPRLVAGRIDNCLWNVKIRKAGTPNRDSVPRTM